MRSSCLLVAAASLTLASCGGRSPAAPSVSVPVPTPTPVPRSVTVTDGDSGRPVPGAQVIVAGAAQLTNAQGQVQLTDSAAGVTVDVVADGFLDRQTLLRPGSASDLALTLWPRRPLHLFDEDYTRALVYTSSSFGSIGASSPLRRLSRTTTQVQVVLPPDLFANSDVRFFHQFAADAMNTAVGGLFRYSVGSESVPGSFNVSVSLNPGAASCNDSVAFTTVGTNGGGDISSASITYCDLSWARNGSVVLHEMGHTMGLRHSSVRSDVMYPFVSVDVFTDRELLTMKLMYQRPSGNAFPDNDRSTSGLSLGRVETIICRH